MDPVAPHFQPQPSDILDLITKHPLAWLVAAQLSAILLPIRPVLSGDRKLSGFHGHMPRWMSAEIEENSNTLLLFTGEQAYLSPSWFTNRNQAPTWASQSATFRCSIHFSQDPQALRDSLKDLIDSQEEGRDSAWDLEEFSERYEQLAKYIIPFRCEIIDCRASFRLAQDEDDQTFADVVAGLGKDGKGDMARLMQSFRPSSRS